MKYIIKLVLVAPLAVLWAIVITLFGLISAIILTIAEIINQIRRQ